MPANRIGIFAASSIVPVAELNLGVALLKDAGFDVFVHPQLYGRHFIYPGTDAQRAAALYEMACDEQIDVLWAARGGYGAAKILPLLDQLTRERGKPKRCKLLAGFSDVTVLHEFVRQRWGWATLHSAMPAGMSFARLRAEDRDATLACVRGEPTRFRWEQTSLEFITAPPSQSISAELIGGNLSLWQTLAGTPYAPDVAGKILFFEDVDERPYRLDRMLTQIVQSGGLDDVRAILLGDFTRCDDESNLCFKPLDAGEDPRQLLADADKREQIPIRETFSIDASLKEIFGSVGERLKIPIARGLPVGHGPNYCPLPLGATYQLAPNGSLTLKNWAWNCQSEK